MHESNRQTQIAGALAAAFLAGEWTEEALLRRARRAVTPAPRWLRRIVADTLAAYHRPPADRPRELAAYIRLAIEALREPPLREPPRVRQWHLSEQRSVRRRWPVADLDTTADLGTLLGLEPGRLDWLADARGLERSVSSEPLRNYRYAWLPRSGGPPRLIERPKSMLKAAQRRVVREVLDRIPAHDAAHGFVAGRSARSHALAHAGSELVLRLDLEDYFASVGAGRVFGIFRTAGYAEAVAHALTALCTNVVPLAEWAALAPRPPVRRPPAGGSAAGSRRLTSPRVPPPRRRSPGWPPSRSIAASAASPPPSAPATRATRTTSRSPETPASRGARAGSWPS